MGGLAGDERGGSGGELERTERVHERSPVVELNGRNVTDQCMGRRRSSVLTGIARASG
jgi:hypothetical protein